MATLTKGICLALLVAICASEASAESRGGLNTGMEFYDVLKLWGPPLEKREYHGRHRDVWNYPDVRIVFEDGKLVKIEPSNVPSTIEDAQRNSAEVVEGSVASVDPADSTTSAPLEEILTEIMKTASTEETAEEEGKAKSREELRKQEDELRKQKDEIRKLRKAEQQD